MASASGSGGPGPAKASGSGGPPPPPRQERLVNELVSDLKKLLAKVKKPFSAVMGKKQLTKENLEKEIKKVQQEIKERKGKGKVAPKGLLKKADSQSIRDALEACPSQDSQEVDTDSDGVHGPSAPSFSELSLDDPNDFCDVYKPPVAVADQPGPMSLPGVPERLPDAQER